jgi:polyisoprenoid-binding protein YceI
MRGRALMLALMLFPSTALAQHRGPATAAAKANTDGGADSGVIQGDPGAWPIDARHSTASIFLVPGTDPSKGVNLAIAMVAGRMALDADDASRISLLLTIFPANQREALLSADGSLRDYALADLSRYTVMGFQSKRAVRDAGGKLQITGELKIVHVDREAASGEADIAYSGAKSSTPLIEKAVQEVRITVDKSGAEMGRGQRVGYMELNGALRLLLEDLPKLREWLSNSVWPLVVEDRECWESNRPVNWRTSSGATCTGTVVETKPLKELPHGSVLDYSGAAAFPAAKLTEVQIYVNLKLREPEAK